MTEIQSEFNFWFDDGTQCNTGFRHATFCIEIINISTNSGINLSSTCNIFFMLPITDC